MHILWYFLIGLAGVILGAIIGLFFYLIHDALRKRRIKRDVPTDRTLLAIPETKQIDEKEVKEIDRERIRKFREFEKLRRFATTDNTSTPRDNSDTATTTNSERQGKIPSGDNGDIRGVDELYEKHFGTSGKKQQEHKINRIELE